MCWLNDRLAAIWGRGFDAEAMLNGVTVYDVEEMTPMIEFAGVPKGRLWSGGRRLFAVDGDGMSVWDPLTGERTAELPATRPMAFDRWLDRFLVAERGDLRAIRLAPGVRGDARVPSADPETGGRRLVRHTPWVRSGQPW